MKVLEINDIYKRKKKKKILKGVSFDIGEKEVVCMVAPNGSGKSTTIKCITGLFKLDAGDIKICGKDIYKDRKEAFSNIGLCMEEPSLFEELTGIENLEFIAKARGLGKEDIEEVIKFSGLGEGINRRVKTYSLGMRMRLGLSIAFLGKPKLIILDEPTNGLDVDAVLNVRKQLEKLRGAGSSILVSSHYLGEMEKIADRVLVLMGGKIIKNITMDEIKSQYGELETMYKELCE